MQFSNTNYCDKNIIARDFKNSSLCCGLDIWIYVMYVNFICFTFTSQANFGFNKSIKNFNKPKVVFSRRNFFCIFFSTCWSTTKIEENKVVDLRDFVCSMCV